MTTSRSGKKLLVADDSLTIQKVIRLALSNEGYEIQTVSDGNEALQQISVFRPDLILVDVSLPGKTAFELKEQVNRQGDLKETRFVLMSSAFEKVDEQKANEVGFDGRLTKPFDPGNLRQVLNDVLAVSGESEPPMAEDFLKSSSEPLPQLPSDDALWSTDEGSDPFAKLAPPPLPPMSAEAAPDQDIRNLTESTIRMSGLDDFQWSINENSRKEQVASPGTPPPFEHKIHELPPIFPHRNMADTGGTSFELDAPDEAREAAEPEPDPIGITGANLGSESADVQGTIAPPPLTPAQMEELVEKQVREALEQMARKLLPEIAERVIKQEIHRMLQEQP